MKLASVADIAISAFAGIACGLIGGVVIGALALAILTWGSR